MIFPLVLSVFVGSAAHAGNVSHELLVKVRDSTPGTHFQAQVLSDLQNALGAKAILGVRPLKTDPALEVIELGGDSQVQKALGLLRKEPAIEFAERNQLVHALGESLPNDPELYRAWGIKNTGQMGADFIGDINVLSLWGEGVHGSRKIVVAVIDTGIDWTHPDLAANLYTNPKESGADGHNGKDDDGNGFVDDIHGWNFVAGNNDTRDDNNHGTHCAGSIGAVGDNGVGTAGVNWNVSLLPVKFLDSKGGGTMDKAIEAINYARLMHVDVMSNSWGGGGFSAALQQAIIRARDAGILFVAAAGNDGGDNDAGPTYPASYPVENVVAVAATDYRDRIAKFSNYGKTSVHLAAPGVKIFSTFKDGDYGTLSGTSMAAPYVAGVAALLKSANPSWGFAELKRRMIASADPVQGLRNKVVAHGRVNAYNAYHGVETPNPVPLESLWRSVAQNLESEHPYKNNANTRYKISAPGAAYVRVHFERFEVETAFDKVLIETPNGEVVEELTGNLGALTSEFIKGDTLFIHLLSDYSGNRFGFQVDRMEIINQ